MDITQHVPSPAAVADFPGNVAIVGRQRSGKTTLLAQFLSDLLDQDDTDVYVTGVFPGELTEFEHRVKIFERGNPDPDTSGAVAAVSRLAKKRLECDSGDESRRVALVVDNGDVWDNLGRLNDIIRGARRTNVRVIGASTEFDSDSFGYTCDRFVWTRIWLNPWEADDYQAIRMFERWRRSPYGARTLVGESSRDAEFERKGDLLIPREHGVALAVTDPDELPTLVRFPMMDA